MSQLERYIEKYGPLAGLSLYHALQSRARFHRGRAAAVAANWRP